MALTLTDDALLPTITQIFSGSAADCAGLTAPANGTIVRDTNVYETNGGSVHLTLDASQTNAIFWIELPSDTSVLGTINFRIRSPNWRAFRRIGLILQSTSGAVTNQHYIDAAAISGDNVACYFGIVSYPWTADTWRTLRTVATNYTAEGSPATWDNTSPTKTVRRIGIRLTTGSASGEIYLDRVETEDYSKGFVKLVLDGSYVGALSAIVPSMVAAERNFSATVYKAYGDTLSPGLDAAVYPSAAALLALAGQCDFSIHGRRVDNAIQTYATTLSRDVADGMRYWAEHFRTFIGLGDNVDLCRYIHAQLGDKSVPQGYAAAEAMESVGVLASRASCSDSTYQFLGGESTFPSGYIHGALNAGPFRMQSVIPQHGPYNYRANGIATYTVDNIETAIKNAVAFKLCLCMYCHDVIAVGDTQDISSDVATGMLALFDTYAADLEFVSIADLHRITFGRMGDSYVNRLGEWTTRSNPLANVGYAEALRLLSVRLDAMERKTAFLAPVGDWQGQSVRAGVSDYTAARAVKLDNLNATVSSRHASGAAVAKSPATLDWTADVTSKPTIGTSTLAAQDVRDAMKLAPSSGDPAAGSIDKQVDDIEAQL